jgi:hypothetical protein
VRSFADASAVFAAAAPSFMLPRSNPEAVVPKTKPKTTKPVVNLPVPLDGERRRELIVDMCRFAESILSEKQIRRRWRFDEAAWDALGADDELVRTIEEESARRIRDGSCKKEKAQLLVVKAPDVLGNIMMDDGQSARHRIDSAKALNDFAANGPAGAAAGAVFEITINLGADSDGKPVIEHYRKPLAAIDVTPSAAQTSNREEIEW